MKKDIIPLRITERKGEETIDLFFSTNDKFSHYSLVKNFGRFINNQLSFKNTKECKRCFNYFGKKDLLNEHKKNCENYNSAYVKMPEKDSYLNFQNYKKMFPDPFVIYADFESFTQRVLSTQPNPKYFLYI